MTEKKSLSERMKNVKKTTQKPETPRTGSPRKKKIEFDIPIKELRFCLRTTESAYRKNINTLKEKHGNSIPDGIPWYDCIRDVRKFIEFVKSHNIKHTSI